MKVFKSQVWENVTSVFQAFSLIKIGFASDTIWPVCSRQLESPVTPVSGTSSSIVHNGNMHPSLSLAHSVQLKEEFSGVLLDALKCGEYGLEVIRDFKMVAFLRGLEDGFTKFPYYLWDSTDTAAHYHRQDWSQLTEFTVGRYNVKWEPLLNPGICPPTTALKIVSYETICHRSR